MADAAIVAAGTKRARAALARHGLLMQADAELPSLASLVADAPIRGSWWSHTLAHEIYDVCQVLDADPDVLRLKLLKGKVTLVHASLFGCLAALGAAREPWQLERLSPAAKRLLAKTDARGFVRLDQLAPRTRDAYRARAKAAAELERSLLAVGDEVHTESGAHARTLESWMHWRARRPATLERVAPTEARARIEAAVDAQLGAGRGARLLPWQASLRAGRRRKL